MTKNEEGKNCFFFGKKAPPPEKTKDLILEEAKKHFCEKGYEGASIRDICTGVGANVSAIKYHFGGKEGLYRECFRQFGESRLNSASQILTKVNSLDELRLRLKLFCEDFIKEGLASVHTTKMICREIEIENPLIEDIFQATFLKIYQTVVDFFIDAQEKNIIRKEIDAKDIASFFFHTLTTSIRTNHVGEKYFNRTLRDKNQSEAFINNIITIVLDGSKV